MSYRCDLCEYSTDDRGNFYKHKHSKKHLENVVQLTKTTTSHVKITSNNAINAIDDIKTITIGKVPTTKKSKKCKRILECPVCKKKYKHQSSLYRHKKQCDVNNHQNFDHFMDKFREYEFIIEKQKWEMEKAIMEKEKAILETKLEYESKENREARDFIKSGRMAPTYLSVKNFVLQNFPDAPALECLKDYDDSMESYKMIQNEEYDLLDVLMYYNEHGQLHKYLGDFLKANYKKTDPSKQSIWNSDASRLNYIIKEIISDKKSSDWYSDKSGVKTKQYIIDPLINYIRELVVNHTKNLNDCIQELMETDEMTKEDHIEYNNKFEEMGKVVKLQSKIDNDLGQEILRYIAPLFYLEPNGREYKEVKCLPTKEISLPSLSSKLLGAPKDVIEENEQNEEEDDDKEDNKIVIRTPSNRQKTEQRVLSDPKKMSSSDSDDDEVITVVPTKGQKTRRRVLPETKKIYSSDEGDDDDSDDEIIAELMSVKRKTRR